MLIAEMYYVVFYDVDLPKDVSTAMHKRIDRNKFINITDGIIEKTVQLENDMYKIISVATFSIINSVDNTVFAVCDVVKLNKRAKYISTKLSKL